MDRIANAVKIVGLCISAVAVYGIIHDQVTVRMCPEYFTVGHKMVFGEQSPTVLALLWGIRGSFWAGLMLGVGLALAANLGAPSFRPAVRLVRPLLVLLICMALTAGLAGTVGYQLASARKVALDDCWSKRIAEEKQVLFLTDGFIHNGSYVAGILGGLILILHTWVSRRKDQAKSSEAGQPPPTC